ncbi:PorP/SprF family type IX secretion system membrane protein [Pontibacter sp. H249]|uniref:PorP/SprF family type IX secretion system membrane protein n=1 Tax=Pontibacter sp. H249 TaxID=3133420 RepID=UPI0030C4842B
MRAFFTVIILCVLCSKVLGQQRPQLSQYMQNNFLLNPAVAGIESYADVRAAHRSQWIGVEGAPVTFYASVNAALNKQDKSTLTMKNGFKSKRRNGSAYRVRPHHGVGAIAKVDKAGLLRTSSFNLNYAYHLPLSQSVNLASGVYSGFTQFHIDKKDVNMQTEDDPFLHADGLNVLKLDLGVGMWLYTSSFFIGVSGAQLVHTGNDVYNSQDGPRALMQPHYYLTGGLRLPVSDRLDLTPSVMMKVAENKQSAVDFNLKGLYAQRVWGGVSYRHKDAVAVMAGVYLNHLVDISYSYDFVSSDLSKARANSHEVVLGFKLNNPRKILCPEWVW